MPSDDQPSNGITLTSAVAAVSAQDPELKMYVPLPDNNDMYRLVGLVASEWAYVEHKLDMAIWRLLDNDHSKWQDFACLTSQYAGQYARVKAIISLSRARRITTKTVKMLTSLNKDLNSAYDQRNRIVHDAWFWCLPDMSYAQFRSMPQGDPTFGFKEKKPVDMELAIISIRSVRDRVIDFEDSLCRELDALRAEQFQQHPASSAEPEP